MCIARLTRLAVAAWLVGVVPCVADSATMPTRIAEEVLRVLDSDSAPERVRAAMELVHAGENREAAARALRERLDDPSPAVRSACLHALGQLQVKHSLPAIIDACNDPHKTVRIAACEALAALGKGGAGRLPFDDPDPAVRLAALQAVSEEGGAWTETAERRLEKRWANEKAPDLRAGILDVYRSDGRCPPLAALTTALDEGTPVVRLAALRCLSDVSELPDGATEHLAPGVKTLFEDSMPAVRRQAVRALARLGLEGELGLLEGLSEDPDHTVRKAVAHAAGGLPHGGAVSALLRRLQGDPAPGVRRAASMSLVAQAERAEGELREAIAEQAARLCSEESAVVRREGLWMLGRLRSQVGFPEILDLAVQEFPDPDTEERTDIPPLGDLRETRLVVWVVQRSGYRPALPKAVDWFLQQEDPATQFHAARAIEANRYEAAVQPLAKAVTMTRTEGGIPYFVYAGLGRTAALQALGTIGTEEALNALAEVAKKATPSDTDKNLALIVRSLAEHERAKEAKRLIKNIVRRQQRVGPESLVAHAYRDIVGEGVPAKFRADYRARFHSNLLAPLD